MEGDKGGVVSPRRRAALLLRPLRAGVYVPTSSSRLHVPTQICHRFLCIFTVSQAGSPWAPHTPRAGCSAPLLPGERQRGWLRRAGEGHGALKVFWAKSPWDFVHQMPTGCLSPTEGWGCQSCCCPGWGSALPFPCPSRGCVGSAGRAACSRAGSGRCSPLGVQLHPHPVASRKGTQLHRGRPCAEFPRLRLMTVRSRAAAACAGGGIRARFRLGAALGSEPADARPHAPRLQSVKGRAGGTPGSWVGASRGGTRFGSVSRGRQAPRWRGDGWQSPARCSLPAEPVPTVPLLHRLHSRPLSGWPRPRASSWRLLAPPPPAGRAGAGPDPARGPP